MTFSVPLVSFAFFPHPVRVYSEKMEFTKCQPI